MENQFSEIAGLVGDPVRAKILWALLDKRAYTATELAIYADTTPQNISMHLNKLVKADLLKVESQGRHKYYNYARAEVPYAIEALASLMPKEQIKTHAINEEKPIRFCRSCYDHLAGKVGVMVTDGLLKCNYLQQEEDTFWVTEAGEKWFNNMSIDLIELKKQKRHFAKPCLDWTERRYHLAGALGAALLDKMLSEGWLRRIKGDRTLTLTGKGEHALFEQLGVEIYQTA